MTVRSGALWNLAFHRAGHAMSAATLTRHQTRTLPQGVSVAMKTHFGGLWV
jgi:hypothetical protein